ncbi:MAG: hypothetical protein AAF569_07710 [Pseudomonadota bacterium]
MKPESRALLEELKYANSNQMFRASKVRAAFREAGATSKLLQTKQRTPKKPGEFSMTITLNGASGTFPFVSGSRTMVRKAVGIGGFNLINAALR